jgi:uncharacterized OsmC-like protein
MAITQKTLVPMAVSAECPTYARTSARAGKHQIVIDEPAARGGSDLGPTPIETMIASLLGCTNVILNRVAEKNHVEVKALSLAAEANFDRRGVLLEEEVAVPFPEIRLTINLTTPATDLQVERVKADLGRFCPVSRKFPPAAGAMAGSRKKPDSTPWSPFEAMEIARRRDCNAAVIFTRLLSEFVAARVECADHSRSLAWHRSDL